MTNPQMLLWCCHQAPLSTSPLSLVAIIRTSYAYSYVCDWWNLKARRCSFCYRDKSYSIGKFDKIVFIDISNSLLWNWLWICHIYIISCSGSCDVTLCRIFGCTNRLFHSSHDFTDKDSAYYLEVKTSWHSNQLTYMVATQLLHDMTQIKPFNTLLTVVFWGNGEKCNQKRRNLVKEYNSFRTLAMVEKTHHFSTMILMTSSASDLLSAVERISVK